MRSPQCPRSTEPSTSQASLARARGALLASAYADAAGHLLPDAAGADSDRVARAVRGLPTGARYGAATALTLALVRHLDRRGGAVDVPGLCGELDAAYRAHEQHHPASAIPVASGAEPGWSVAAVEAGRRSAAAGAGPAGWIAPVGLLPDLPLGSVAALARRIAIGIASTPAAQDSAVAQAVATAVAVRTADSDHLDIDRFVDMVGAHVMTPAVGETLRVVRMMVTAAAQPPHVAAQFRVNRRSPRMCVGSALTAFLLHFNDPAACVRAAFLQAGPVTEVAVMAAALVGARSGEAGLPRSWPTALQLSLELGTAAAALAALR